MTKKTKRSIQWIITKKNSKYSGIHLIADFWYGKIIEDPNKIKKILIKAVKEANNTPLKVAIHKFNPQGITGVILLAESHIALHSWPEFNYLAIDIYTCGDKTTPKKALDYLKKEFQPKKIEIKEIKRGKFINIEKNR
ncbi:MAG: adenosylmethionine decarboxylase [Patescibacteria group bacterium]|nr:adenosylmethionine decarboxylase [Patescibacteria group bacterium]